MVQKWKEGRGRREERKKKKEEKEGSSREGGGECTRKEVQRSSQTGGKRRKTGERASRKAVNGLIAASESYWKIGKSFCELMENKCYDLVVSVSGRQK